MALGKQSKYYEDSDITYSAIYGRNFYAFTGRMVQDPLSGAEGSHLSPLLENIYTGEQFFMKKLNEPAGAVEKYIQKIKNPPERRDILWPCDLVGDLTEKDLADENCDLYVDRVYSYEEETGSRYESLGVLFPYGGYPVMEDGRRYLAKIGPLTWKNEKIREMMIQIASRIRNVNRYGYLYLDFHFERMFFREDGELYLNYSNLIFPDSIREREYGRERYDLEKLTYPVEFAEPAIVQGIQKRFDKRAQNYCIAAMFFYLMFGRYAYDGMLLDGYSDLNEREHYEKFRDYHKMPIFIFDPDDTSNALGDFSEEQLILDSWNEAPEEIRTMMTDALGQKNAVRQVPDQNPTPEEWLNCFRKIGWMT